MRLNRIESKSATIKQNTRSDIPDEGILVDRINGLLISSSWTFGESHHVPLCENGSDEADCAGVTKSVVV
jgi:hypothetical protein